MSIYDDIKRIYEPLVDAPAPLREIRLTRAQIESIAPHNPQSWEPSGRVGLLGIPIVEVATVEESTPFQEAVERAERDGFTVVEFDGKHYAIKKLAEAEGTASA